MWSSYVKPELIERFQQEEDCHVVVDTFDSNESMYTKLKLGGSGYDVIFPSSYIIDLLIRADLAAPLQEELIPNAALVDWKFLHRLGLEKTRFALPYMACFSGIAWRKDRLTQAPDSWAIFGSHAYKGRMTMLNDMRETIGAALIYLGHSINTTDPQAIEQAQNLVCQWKKQLARFESEQYKNGIASAEYLVVHGYSGDCLQVAEQNSNIGFLYPKEGSVVSIDYAVIMKSAKHKKLAHAFLNFLHSPEVAAENMQFTCFRCLNTQAPEYLPHELKTSVLLYPELASTKLECILPVGEARNHYLQAWAIIKASK
jgi:spermidine/putrescine transport system substrate-binding protein